MIDLKIELNEKIVALMDQVQHIQHKYNMSYID